MKAINQSNQYINPWTKEDEDFIKQNHGILSYREMSQKLNRTYSSIENKARRLGLKKKSKYYYNSDFFEVIDSEEKAYWLGFIYADGYVNVQDNRHFELGIELQYSDNNHLKKFNKSLNGNVKIKDRYRNGSFEYNKNKIFHFCNIRFYNQKIVNDLSKYGIVNSKTYVKQHISDLIPKHLLQHFIRGFFDGDGAVYLDIRKCVAFNITNANNLILEDIRQFLYNNYDIKSYISCEEDKQGSTVPIYQLNFKGMYNAYKFGQFLYNDVTIYLDRKYLLYQRYIRDNNIIKRINSFNNKT